jgi:hypothetical protein
MIYTIQQAMKVTAIKTLIPLFVHLANPVNPV